MLQLTKLRDMTLQASSSPGRPVFLSAASGLVRIGAQLYVVADDELHLAKFSLEHSVPGELLRVFAGELPSTPKQRKKHKPDLEVLTLLPPFAAYPHGALLALGSGSTQRRCRGVLLPLGAQGEVSDVPRILDATVLFAELAQHFAQLNLEGAWVWGNDLCLLQRGNKRDAINAVIRLDLQALMTSLKQGDVLPALTPLAVHVIQLGAIAGIPLSFTDASVLPDGRWLFTAVAEDTNDAYADGTCVGAAIGMVDANHELLWIERVAPACKIEGIDVQQQRDALQVLLVTDADDPHVPAGLFAVQLLDRHIKQ